MFGLFRRKSPAKKSALIGQKPRRRRSLGAHGRNSDSHGIPLAAKFAVVVTLVCLIGLAYNRSSELLGKTYERFLTSFHIPTRHWDVQIMDGDGDPLSDDLRKDIYRISARTLKSGSPSDLASLISGVEALGTLEQVSVVRPRYQSVVVKASVRKPAMMVTVGPKTRYLTVDGTVYGELSDDFTAPAAQPTLVTLSGIFETRSGGFQFDHSMRLIVSPDEKTLLLDGLQLGKLVSKQSLEVKSINHQGYRGFAIVLTDGTEVVLGPAPFEYKLEKLLSILGKLKSQGSTASRIELDYDGKAFIKERKI